MNTPQKNNMGIGLNDPTKSLSNNSRFTHEQQLICYFISEEFQNHRTAIDSFKFYGKEYVYSMIKSTTSKKKCSLEANLFSNNIFYHYYPKEKMYSFHYDNICEKANVHLMLKTGNFIVDLTSSDKTKKFQVKLNISELEYKTILVLKSEAERKMENADQIHGLYSHKYGATIWVKVKNNAINNVEPSDSILDGSSLTHLIRGRRISQV